MSLVEISATNDVTARCDPRTTSRIPDELLCPLCGNLLSEAVMLPCCAISTCEVCAKDALKISLKEGVRACPLKECTLECSLQDLIPHRRLRQNALTLRQQYPNVFETKNDIFTIKGKAQNIKTKYKMEIVPMKTHNMDIEKTERRRKYLDYIEKMDRGLSTFIQNGLTNTSYLKREQLPTPLPLSSDEVIIKKMKEFSSHIRANGVPKSWKAPVDWITKESILTGIKQSNIFPKTEVFLSMPAAEGVNDSIDEETVGTPLAHSTMIEDD